MDSKMFSPAWWLGGVVVLAFIAGFSVDADHPLADLLGISDRRFLHPYFHLASHHLVGGGLGLVVALLGRYAWVRLLRMRNTAKAPGYEMEVAPNADNIPT